MGTKALEAFKFSVYVLLPIAAGTYCTTPDAIEWIVRSKNYIQYPPAGVTRQDFLEAQKAYELNKKLQDS